MSEKFNHTENPFAFYRDTLDDIVGFEGEIDERRQQTSDCGWVGAIRDFDANTYTLERIYPAGDDCTIVLKRIHIDLFGNKGRLIETVKHSSDDQTDGEVIVDIDLECTHYDWTEDAEEIVRLFGESTSATKE